MATSKQGGKADAIGHAVCMSASGESASRPRLMRVMLQTGNGDVVGGRAMLTDVADLDSASPVPCLEG